MTGCLSISFDRVGGGASEIHRIGGADALVSRMCGDASSVVSRVGGMDTDMLRKGGVYLAVGLVCGVSLGEQGIIWASDGRLLTLENGYLIGA